MLCARHSRGGEFAELVNERKAFAVRPLLITGGGFAELANECDAFAVRALPGGRDDAHLDMCGWHPTMVSEEDAT